ncbi:MAG TPA: ADYC domain-containing protein [Hyalangium sp.]|jgi:hypothetical protein|nr:ADYC domain-containing protein [Hyalangium sp.]
MNVPHKSLLPLICLLLTSTSWAADTASSTGPAGPLSQAERYARRCQKQAPERYQWPQGPYLWGSKLSWDDSQPQHDSRHSVLVSVDTPSLSKDAVGSVLSGSASDGSPVEVSICEAEPDPSDPQMVWYRIEAWNPVAQAWDNPCIPSGSGPNPRALAVSGVWDSTGAHQQVKGKLTLACENGVISKCITWGYKPWASRNGQPLAPLHQACTRMARADYCGNGISHTQPGTPIDMYDSLGVQTPTTQPSQAWNPARASFEAAWVPDGATCLSRTRLGKALETILQECPGRFRASASVDLGQGDVCTLQRSDVNPSSALLKNRSY